MTQVVCNANSCIYFEKNICLAPKLIIEEDIWRGDGLPVCMTWEERTE